ncbi:helix-turn-helix domain-containing protein [Spirosoma spitsbergense]|uniref:helix-turn-helix domain-containing protein n=1 Tax=Spirosoma spitsbergense TaxID=431554 RepID=UPI00036CBBE5|nr:helix-turn-helix transcriptional regulator [Spirosoma spitsbergense]
MTISPFDLLILLGSLQGFILATLLWTNAKGRRLSNRLLAVLIGLLALMSLAVGVPIANGWVSLALDVLPFFMVMPVGPLIYFYVQSVSNPNFQLRKKERLQLLPVVLDWGAPLIVWTFYIGFFLGFWPREDGPSWGEVMNEYNTYADIPRWLSVTTYLFLTARFLDRQQRTDTNSITDEQRGTMRWLRQFIRAFLVFQCVWLLHLVLSLIPAFRNTLLDRVGWYPIYIPLAGLIYWLGFKGYLHSRPLASVSPTSKPTGPELPDETVAQVTSSLLNAMTNDRLFLDPELTVEKVGQNTGLTPKIISAVLNQHLRKNFNSFINEYRVEEIKQRLTTPAYEHLTLTGIAFECGFNSQATFQRAFKQQTGMSPGEFASRQKKTAQIRI